MENGLFLHPLGSTIYIQAPYVITEQQLEKIYSVIETALETL
jgi:adenosylmethionine-8-amino-7-oxononanoate aminotransferase